MLSFILNQETIHTDMPPGMTVLDFIRYHKHLTGTKIGCREGDCGACTILVGEDQGSEMRYRSMTCCLMPLSNAEGKHIVTIEGINPPAGQLTPVQEAMVEENGTQCGFCTVGFVVSLTGFCLNNKEATAEAAISSIDGNICRCTGYKSIERASSKLINLLKSKDGLTPISFAIAQKIVPPWFAGIRERLEEINSSVSTSLEDLPKTKPVIISGGTDLYVQRPEEMVHTVAVNVFNQNNLKEIRDVGSRIEIGASVTVSDLMESPVMNALFPKLKKHLKLVSSTPIRNMATVAGNLVNASPIGDLTVWFLAMKATVVVRNGLKDGKAHEIPLCDFYQGYKKLAKKANEVVEKIYFDKPDHTSRFNFEKVSKRTFLDIATVNTAIHLRVTDHLIIDAHLSAGGVGPVPLYLKNTSSCLKLKRYPFDKETLHEMNHILQSEISPISDVRGSATYKRLLMKQLFLAHFKELFPSS
ncbi:MAG TPA: FAD binding domain-containing protein [Saprospiraceae bacterium]|nr:FAD binding domain-containing protein [Saprospiraceae bacterium]